MLIRHALVLTNEKELTERTRIIKEETVKLLCIICTVKTNRFYIPGETKMVEYTADEQAAHDAAVAAQQAAEAAAAVVPEVVVETPAPAV